MATHHQQVRMQHLELFILCREGKKENPFSQKRSGQIPHRSSPSLSKVLSALPGVWLTCYSITQLTGWLMPSPDGNLGPVWDWDHTETGVWLSQGCRNDTRAGVGEMKNPWKCPGGILGLGWATNRAGIVGNSAPPGSWRTRENLHFINMHCSFTCCSRAVNTTPTPAQLFHFKLQDHGIIGVGKDLQVTGSQQY